MKLTLESLAAQGAFVGPPVEKDVTWEQDGEELTATVFVRRLAYDSAMADIAALRANSDAAAGRIAASIVDEEGKPIFTAADITGEADPDRGALNYNLTMELLRVIGEVNRLGKRPAKSTKKKSSGTSS